MNVGVVSYGVGNSKAISRMYELLGVDCQVVKQPDELWEYSHLILPGVGNFGHALALFHKSGWDVAILKFVQDRSNLVLGLCLGAQLLGHSSEEADGFGLGILPIDSVRLKTELPIPHMGWRKVSFSKQFIALNREFEKERYYFSHSFEMKAFDPNVVIGTFSYGEERVAVVRKDNVIGAQFHPEKSSQFGKKFLAWFAEQ